LYFICILFVFITYSFSGIRIILQIKAPNMLKALIQPAAQCDIYNIAVLLVKPEPYYYLFDCCLIVICFIIS